jgi:nicotinamide-nucleotide amidase
MPDPSPTSRHLATAELLSIGTELTVGDTRDTNAGVLARALTALGVRVGRATALPDDLEVVTEAFRAGLERADLVVSTGGLGPTPDDLTREAIAAVCGERPTVDPDLEAWLRELWRRRNMPFPELNLKQAWLIASATALPNPNGTAPGWFVTRPDGRIVVALPGPPREMRAMWADEALPRLQARGLGAEVATRTYRLTGIGESQVADRLGEALLRAANPTVATYARIEAVDVRISALAEPPRTAAELLEETAATVLEILGKHIWATGEATWSGAIGDRLAELGWTLAAVEIGTGGSLCTLLGDADWLRFDEAISPDAPATLGHVRRPDEGGTPASTEEEPDPASGPTLGISDFEDADAEVGDLLRFARRARELGGSEVGIAIRARPRTGDTAVSMAISTPAGEHESRRLVFMTGPIGRSRAALTAAAFLLETLRGVDPPG